MSNSVLFKKVKELKLPQGKYALFGSAQLGIRGLRECDDIDIIVTEDLWNEYRKKNWETRIIPSGDECLWQDGIELWKDWKPGEWDVGQLIKETEIIEGLPFVKLETVLEWKKIKGGEKDLKDIEIIEKFLAEQK